MQTLLLTFGLFLVVVLVMAVGVIFTGRSLRGSCGGPSCSCQDEGRDLGSCEFEEGLKPPTRQA